MKDLGPNTRLVIDWIHRMSARHGGIVFDNEVGRQWDWGQALCRQLYGPGWNSARAFKEADEMDDTPYASVLAAREWEAGEWPEWASRPDPDRQYEAAREREEG